MHLLKQIFDEHQVLRIGYYDHDGHIPPLPGVKRGLNEAKAALERMGHTVSTVLIYDIRINL